VKSLAVLMLLMVGCASAPLTEDEQYAREDRIVRDMGVWSVCQRVYHGAGRPTIHKGHRHDGRSKSIGRQVDEMRDDIASNGCRRIYEQVIGEK